MFELMQFQKRVKGRDCFVVVNYAHTGDSLEFGNTYKNA
jgi:hypothetical protein